MPSFCAVPRSSDRLHARFAGKYVRPAVLAAAMLAVLPASALNIDPKADVHPTAVLMGNITVGPYTRIGPKVVIEGDVTIGHHVNILGNAVIHGDRLTIRNYVRIDYGARVLDGRPADETYIRDNCWVGINRSEERRAGKECRSRWSPY